MLYKDEDKKKEKGLRMKKIVLITKITINTDKHKTIPNDFIQREFLN
jgi:hypothetical protein